jgi:hypothetical protein
LPDDHLVLKFDAIGRAHPITDRAYQAQHIRARSTAGIDEKIGMAVAHLCVAHAKTF